MPPDILDGADWRTASRRLAHALRDLVHRHPHSASLLMSRRVASASQLRLYGAYLHVLNAADFERAGARELLRILVAYGFGYAQTELAAFAPPPSDERHRRIQSELTDELLAVAREVCRGTDTTAQFDLGLTLMLRGLETQSQGPAPG